MLGKEETLRVKKTGGHDQRLTNRKSKLIEVICIEEQISGWGRDETEEMQEMGNLFGVF